MKRAFFLKTAAILICWALLPITSEAFPQSGGNQDNQGNQKKHGPPPEAIAACKGKNVGDAVTFTGRRGESLEATCATIQGMLVAVPKDGPRPPQEQDQ